MDMREAFEVLRNNVQSETGDVRIAGLRDNDEVRDALHFALSHIGDGSKVEPVKYEYQGQDGYWYGFDSEKHFQNTKNAGFPMRALYTHPAPTAQDSREYAVGKEVSIDISTGDDDADHRVFGRITEWQPYDGKIIYLADLESTNPENRLAQDSKVPEALPMRPYQTVDMSSTNYKAGWNACRKAMLSAAPVLDKPQREKP